MDFVPLGFNRGGLDGSPEIQNTGWEVDGESSTPVGRESSPSCGARRPREARPRPIRCFGDETRNEGTRWKRHLDEDGHEIRRSGDGVEVSSVDLIPAALNSC